MDTEIEIWKDVVGFEEYFSVSNLGRVRSKRKPNHIYKLSLEGKGYLRFGTTINGIHNTYKVHRLVAITFIPNPENKSQVNHIDGDKLNNRVDNLEWVTNSENIQHAYDIGIKSNPKGENSHMAKLTQEDVDFIRKNYKARDKVFGRKALAIKFNVNASTIYRIISNKSY